MTLDEEIEKLRKKKPSLREEHVRALMVALKDFRASSRYELLKLLPLSQFLTSNAAQFKSIRKKTLEELVEAGPVEICATGKLSANGVQKITEVFFRLRSDPASAPPPVRAKVFSLPHLRAVPERQSSALPVMNSVEAEKQLEESIQKLKRSPRFEHIADNRLGDFWDRELVSAPFEESITLRQLSEMKARTLLEKRSFGQKKILGVIRAIDTALGANTEQARASGIPAPVSVPESSASVETSADTPTLWPVLGRALAKHAWAVLRLYEYQACRARASSGPLSRLVREIPQRVLPLEFLAAWYLQDHHEDIVARLLAVDRNEIVTLCDLAHRKIDRLISETASELRSYWEIALRGPGIGSEKLIEIFRDPALEEPFQIALCQILLSSTGARHPIVFGEDLSRYWSKSPSALQMSITALISSLPKSDDAVNEELEALFPFFEKSVLLSILKRQAFFRERDRVWVKRDGDVA